MTTAVSDSPHPHLHILILTYPSYSLMQGLAIHNTFHNSCLQVRAQKKATQESTKESTAERDAEAERIAELERRSSRGRKKIATKQANPTSASSTSSGGNGISSGGNGFAEWNERELLPKGFDKMNPVRSYLA